jgi:hypothetical protein
VAGPAGRPGPAGRGGFVAVAFLNLFSKFAIISGEIGGMLVIPPRPSSFGI